MIRDQKYNRVKLFCKMRTFVRFCFLAKGDKELSPNEIYIYIYKYVWRSFNYVR